MSVNPTTVAVSQTNKPQKEDPNVSKPVASKKFQTFPDYGFAIKRPFVSLQNAWSKGLCGCGQNACCGPVCGPLGAAALPFVHTANRVTTLALGRYTDHTTSCCCPLNADSSNGCVLADPLNVCSVNVCSNIPFASDVVFLSPFCRN